MTGPKANMSLRPFVLAPEAAKTMGLKNAILDYFASHPRAKKALGLATAVATNFAMIGSGSAVLAVAAGSIVKAHEDNQRINPDQLMDFFKEAIQDPSVRDSIKDAVREGGSEVATHVSTAMNQLGAADPQSGQFVDTMKSDIAIVLQDLGLLQEMLSYYEVPDSIERIQNVWRLPHYLDDVMVIDNSRQAIIDSAVKHAKSGENVAVLGPPGSGKTTAMYAILKKLGEDTDTGLVWDTKDVARTHESSGMVLFCDDLPESRELSKALVEKDIKGIVTTAREQDWSRLPIDLRRRFKVLNLPSIPDAVMTEIARNHLTNQAIKFEEAALPIIVKNAQGSPIYVRYMVEELGAEAKTGNLKKLTARRAEVAPKGMTDYIAEILARILFELDGTIYKPREGALPAIKALLCLADMPNYETHEVHLNQMFFALKEPSDGPGPFNAFKQYLSRDPRFYSFKFMHDTLADVLRGRVDHPIVGDIRMIAQEMGVAGRRKVEMQAHDDGWAHVKEEYDINKGSGLEQMISYAYFSAKNFGLEHTDSEALRLANRHMEHPLSQALFAITGPMDESAINTAESRLKETRPEHKKHALPAGEEKPPVSLNNLGAYVQDKIAAALGGKAAREIEGAMEELGAEGVDIQKILNDAFRTGNLESLKELKKLRTKEKEVQKKMKEEKKGKKE